MKSAIETDEMKKWCEIRSLEKIQEKCLKRKELKLGFSIQSHCFVCDTKENEDIEIVAQIFSFGQVIVLLVFVEPVLRAWSDNVDPAFTKVTWTGSGPGGWAGSGLRYAAMLGYGLFDLPWLLQNRDASSHAECSYKTSFLSFSNFTNNDHIFNWLLNVRNRENIKINHALNHNYLMKPNNESFLKIETKICVLFETLDLDRKLENVNQHLKF